MTVDHALVAGALMTACGICLALAEALHRWVRERRDRTEFVVTHVDHEKRVVTITARTPEKP